MTDIAGGTSTERAATVAKAAKRWAESLVDISGRNNLLFYRDLKTGTLRISDALPADDDSKASCAVNKLLAGKEIQLSALVRDTDGSVEQVDAARRARAIAKKAKENVDERGLHTAHIALGAAAWTETKSKSAPNAPIILAPIEIVATGLAADDFSIKLAGDWVLNPTLLFMLRTQFGADMDGDAAPDPDDDGFDYGDVLLVLDEFRRNGCNTRPAIPGFQVTTGAVIGNFAYTKQPMVTDLETALEELAGHDLIAALAGDQEAGSEIRAGLLDDSDYHPDLIPPQDEYLVLDADSSQQFVINAVKSGSNLVVQGPPGTGKSQTVANLIATLVADGQSVLFVAEKRAAIDAVVKRLDHVGLRDIVMDLHSGAIARRQVARDLAAALDQVSSTAPVDRSRELDQLKATRTKLVDHDDAINSPREPWAESVFDIQARLLRDPADRTIPAFNSPVLETLTTDMSEQIEAWLIDWVDHDGPHAGDLSRHRSAALAADVDDHATVRRVIDAIDGIAEPHLSNAEQAINALHQEVGCSAPPTLAANGILLEVAEDAAQVAQTFRPEVHNEASELRESLGKSFLSRKRRRARRRMAELSPSEEPQSRAEMIESLDSIISLQGRWSEAGLSGNPKPLASEPVASQWFGWLAATADPLSGAIPPDVDSFETIRSIRDELVEDKRHIMGLPELKVLNASLTRAGMTHLLERATKDNLSSEELVKLFWSLRDHSILSELNIADRRVGQFLGTSHSKTRDSYLGLDRDHIATGRLRVQRAWAEHATSARNLHRDQEQLVSSQAAKKRNHLPFRELFDKAPDVLKGLKPCWVMSPLVVSQLLPARAGLFDVVVFDEASQITPAEAVPALLRGKRAVVAGDSKQLPPTAFFSSNLEPSEEADDLDATADMESILDAMSIILPVPKGTRTLTWHYRSRDERLIAFSNAQDSLYSGRLVTFPGVIDDAIGHVLVEGQHDGAGDPRSSSCEVTTVVDLIRHHAQTRPEESLGVITMGINHSDRVDAALYQAALEEDVLAEALDEGHTEPLFIKNLERVQGDERDAIILSIGYTKGSDGRLRHHFGPINQSGGERRLNVAVTRARRRLLLVSSFGSHDLDPSRLNAEGAAMLRRYLQYAESGGAAVDEGPLTEARMNPFEQDMYDGLTERGIPTHPQYGVGSYRIDFALADPLKPGRMVLAVEADGASYHSSRSARDRDRLRQEHLERLGWTFHRVWSTEWFRDRNAELDAVQASWTNALGNGANSHDGANAAGSNDTLSELGSHESAAPPPKRTLTEPLFFPGDPISSYTHETLVSIVRWVRSDGLLRTDDDLLAVVIAEMGYKRRGARIVDALQVAIADPASQV